MSQSGVGVQSMRGLRIFVTLVMAGVAVFAVGSLIEAIFGSTLTMPLDLGRGDVDVALPAGASLVDGSANVEVALGVGYRLLWWMVSDAVALAGIGFLELFRRILGTADDPFVEVNARRLRWMAYVALVFVVGEVLQGTVAGFLQAAADFDELSSTLDLGALWVPFLIVVLLEFWRRGIDLRNESELTI